MSVLASLFGRRDSSHGACISAGTAVDANFGINVIDVSFVDGTLRALSCAGSACNTISF